MLSSAAPAETAISHGAKVFLAVFVPVFATALVSVLSADGFVALFCAFCTFKLCLAGVVDDADFFCVCPVFSEHFTVFGIFMASGWSCSCNGCTYYFTDCNVFRALAGFRIRLLCGKTGRAATAVAALACLSTAGWVILPSHLSALEEFVAENLVTILSSLVAAIEWSSRRTADAIIFFGVSEGDMKLNSFPDGVLGAVYSTRSGLLALSRDRIDGGGHIVIGQPPKRPRFSLGFECQKGPWRSDMPLSIWFSSSSSQSSILPGIMIPGCWKFAPN